MVTVEVDAGGVERRLGEGLLACPGCGGRLSRWGHAPARSVRGLGVVMLWVRPRRARCSGCGVTHVLLPVSCLLRRADTVDVIGAALAARAGGAGHRSIAAQLGRSPQTVRGWLRRFACRLEAGPLVLHGADGPRGHRPGGPTGGRLGVGGRAERGRRGLERNSLPVRRRRRRRRRVGAVARCLRGDFGGVAVTVVAASAGLTRGAGDQHELTLMLLWWGRGCSVVVVCQRLSSLSAQSGASIVSCQGRVG